MRSIILLLLSYAFLSFCPLEPSRKEFDLTVKVTGIVGTKGYIEFGLFDDPDKYATVGGTCRKIRKATSHGGVWFFQQQKTRAFRPFF
jgi:uncharacterized protein (DUF2141 family)